MKNKVTHILIVDDSPATIFYNKMIIAKTGLAANVSTANNGAEALTYFDTTANSLNTPDIIFLDINMPVMNGWEFLDHHKKLNDKNSIIILMLGTNLLPKDQKKVKEYCCIKGDSKKMLSKEFIYNLVDKHFDA